jgi:isoquinoline 1-oxidoreductase beta subunit
MSDIQKDAAVTENLKTKTSKKGKWTRRGFITAGVLAGGALMVGVAIRPGHHEKKLRKFVEGEGETLVTAWVKIGEDNRVTAIVPHAEMGQGVLTALGAMLAEEMDVEMDNLEIVEAPAEKDYVNFVLGREFIMGGKQVKGFVTDTVNGAFMAATKAMSLQITGGSASVRFTGTAAMQTAGAAAREMLIKAAAKEWIVKPAELTTKDSHIHHVSSGKSAPYAAFAKAAADMRPNLHPTMKAREDYTLMGTSIPRRDIPSKVDGTAMFGLDHSVEGMKVATVKAAPVHGAKVASMNASDARQMPGVVDVLNMGDYVAVVADGYWQAKQALDMVEVSFTTGAADGASSESIFAQYKTAISGDGKFKKMVKKGDVAQAASEAATVFEADYTVPFLAHACMEPMNALAWVRDGKCDIWTGTQNPLGTRATTAKALDMDFENVTVHNQFLGGGFGRRATPDYTDQAALLSQKMGLPIKLIWTREEDMAQDHYRPSAMAAMRASIGADGYPTSWENTFVHKLDPAEASHIFYNIPNQNIRYTESPVHVRFGPWRSVDHTQHGFYTESFIDELAHEAGLDPYEYRRKLLTGKPRHLAVLDAAAKKAGWGKELPAGQAQGIAITESFMTIVAEVVTVDMNDIDNSGAPRVVHVACAADAGLAVNPDGFKAQMESGIIYGLTAALYGDISIQDGAVEQSNFHDYEMVRMDTAPDIDVVIINSNARIGGAGEPGTPPITPALTNAIFAATGKRIRDLPVKNYDFGEAI